MFVIIVGGIVLVVFLLLIIIPILHKNFVKSQLKYLRNVPGPKPNPYFGNLIDFIGKRPEEFLLVISDIFEKHGNIIKVFNGPIKNVVLVADEKLLEFFLSSNKLIDKSLEYEHLNGWLGTGLLTSTGTKWKKRRRMLTPAFHFSILENFVEVFESVGDIFIKKLESYVGQNPFNIYPLVSLLTLDVISETAMGLSVNAQSNGESEYVRCVKNICSLIHAKNFSVIVAIDTRLYPLTINYYKERATINKLHAHTDAVINRKIRELKEVGNKEEVDETGIKKRVAFLDLLLKSTIDGQYLSRNEIREEVDTFLFEGHDTTSSAISFTLYAIANNPLIQRKALEEQNHLFEDLKTAKPTIAILQEMKYLELIIKETLRLYSPVPMFGRRISEEVEFNNIIFPKGQQITMFPYICHRNPKYFPDPLKFIPERFESITGTHPYMYIPFSAGPRNCIGQKFAMLEMKSIVSKVIRNYELLPAENHELKLAPELILVSKSGVHLSLKKRE